MRPTLIATLTAALGLAAPLAPASADPARLLTYSGVFQDNYTDVVVKPFNAKGAAKVEYVGGDTSASMLGQLRTQKNDPQLDVVIMDATTAALACAEGLVEKITPAMMPVLDELDPQARSGGGECGPAVTFDHLVIVYDSRAVVPPPTSLRAMWDAKWRGRISVSAPPNIQGLALTAIMAHADSGNWRNADGAFRALKDLAPSVQTFDPQPDGYNLILNNTVTFATGWNARAQLYHDRSAGRVGVLLPSEGTVFQINTINVVKGAHNRDAALAFMAYALSPTAQKAFTERMYYGPTNSHAQIAPEAAARTAAAAENKARVIPLDWNEMIKLRDSWNQRWRREVISAATR
ncbi:ABC transporter substrate-binding protein [Limobrevibacterium gyesilva]|uniref:ABC transporter substrate-binding protein n=1 Tax=Limobrevibacterium gyesilva TaxID=2991712 RepID=A0AA41YJI1_9PROT|nr:ABC transporter substrate-binding protein [Limobrevibacterium gyesilva]MCW3473212.1 ABC transporter substrate-binding protein [Limobrevibacterium gyesilva]